jgi:hypothetical protein
MSVLQISYDLNQPGRDYGPLIARIKDLGVQGWCHPLESLWLIVTPSTPVTVRDDLRRYIDQSSKLLVLDVSHDPAAWFGLPQDISDWLIANL